MAKGYIPLFFDTLKETEELTDEEFGRLMRASVMYAMGAENYRDSITGNERYAFPFIKGQIDRNEEIKTARAKAGSSKREQSEAEDNKAEQTATNTNKTEQNEAISPKEKKNNKYKEKEKEQNDMFERFWMAYPRKVAKENARKAFAKINPSEEMFSIIFKELEKQKKSLQWTKDNGMYIPHPATWLNGKRYEDEIPQISNVNVVAQDFGQRDYSDVPDEMIEQLGEEVQAFKAQGVG